MSVPARPLLTQRALADVASTESSLQQQLQYEGRCGDKELNNRPKTPEELLKQITALRESGLYFEGNFPEDGPAAEAYSKMVYQHLINGEGGINGSLAAGNLRIYVVRNPEKWDYRTGEINHYLDDFNGLEWIALFKDVLNCPMGNEPPARNKDVTSEARPYELRFQEAIPEYPMLGRMWNTFADVVYDSKEITELREECLRAKATTTNQQALKGLDKFIGACSDAISNGLGIYLACD